MLSSCFAVFEGRDGIRKVGLGACFGNRQGLAKGSKGHNADMLSTLRRVSWEEKFKRVRAGSSLHKKILVQVIDFVSRTG